MAWETLLDIAAEARAYAADDVAKAADPDYHERDGVLLQVNSRGEKRCPFCGWEPGFGDGR